MNWKKIQPVALEIGKWGLVIWLLLPLTTIQEKYVPFPRIMAGILLLIIFAGKMLYDIMLEQRSKHSERSNAADLLASVGMAVGIALIIGLFVVIIGFAVFYQMQQATAPSTE